jgi:hypothetical protein
MSNEDQLQAIQEIRSMMNKSSRFLSLSGMSGVIIGALAICCAFYMHYTVTSYNEMHGTSFNYVTILLHDNHFNLYLSIKYGIISATLLLVSLAIGFLLTYRKAKKHGESVWDETAWRVVKSLFVPLTVGGLVCIAFIYYGVFYFIAPMMLIFYGFALYNASKYTLSDIYSLGLIDMALGLLGLVFLDLGLLFWTLGFGVMHIVYGIAMHYKYDMKRA